MSRKTNRDHAKRQQRPMMEDKAIAAQISALLTRMLAREGLLGARSLAPCDGAGSHPLFMVRAPTSLTTGFIDEISNG